MKIRIVRIGNSQGIRIPKLLLEQTGLRDEVELEVREGSLVLRAPSAPGSAAASSSDRPYPLAGTLAGEISFVREAVPRRQEDDFAELLERALRGEDVVVERGGRPVARLVPLAAEPRRPGRLKGKIRIAPDFDAPLPPGLAEVHAVKTLKLELPAQLAQKIESLITAGWFASEEEFARLAVSELLRRHSFQLQEQFQREDIQWALRLKAEP